MRAGLFEQLRNFFAVADGEAVAEIEGHAEVFAVHLFCEADAVLHALRPHVAMRVDGDAQARCGGLVGELLQCGDGNRIAILGGRAEVFAAGVNPDEHVVPFQRGEQLCEIPAEVKTVLVQLGSGVDGAHGHAALFQLGNLPRSVIRISTESARLPRVAEFLQ